MQWTIPARRIAAALIALAPMFALAADPVARPPGIEGAELMTRDVTGDPGKEALMLTVTYQAGGASLPHRHDSQVFVYVLEGELTMQIAGSPAVTLRPGQTFYENPTDVHLISANASKTMPAKILVFIVKEKNAPVSTEVAA